MHLCIRHIPIFGGYALIFTMENVYDGLFTTTHPREPGSIRNHDFEHIYISWTPNCTCDCTSPPNDKLTIAPSVDFPLRWCMLPQSKENLRLIFYHGYCQAHRKFFSEPRLRTFTMKEKPRQETIDLRS